MVRKTMKGNQQAYRRYASGFIADEAEELTGAMKENRHAIGDDRFRGRPCVRVQRRGGAIGQECPC
jgi:hypothetical protein